MGGVNVEEEEGEEERRNKQGEGSGNNLSRGSGGWAIKRFPFSSLHAPICVVQVQSVRYIPLWV